MEMPKLISVMLWYLVRPCDHKWGHSISEIEHSISEIVGIFDIYQSKVSCMYWEYLMKAITADCEQSSSQQDILNDYDQRCLARTAYSNKNGIQEQNNH